MVTNIITVSQGKAPVLSRLTCGVFNYDDICFSIKCFCSVLIPFLGFGFARFISVLLPNNWEKWERFEYSFMVLVSWVVRTNAFTPLVISACRSTSCIYRHIWWELGLYRACFLRIYSAFPIRHTSTTQSSMVLLCMLRSLNNSVVVQKSSRSLSLDLGLFFIFQSFTARVLISRCRNRGYGEDASHNC